MVDQSKAERKKNGRNTYKTRPNYKSTIFELAIEGNYFVTHPMKAVQLRHMS